MAVPSARATGGGKALPTWRYAAVLRPEKDQLSGNPCRRETMARVSLGGWLGGESGAGGGAAPPRPSPPRAPPGRRGPGGARAGAPRVFLPPATVCARPPP